MKSGRRLPRLAMLLLSVMCGLLTGCSNVRLPAIDPTGERFFLPNPNYTTLNTPDNCSELSCLPEPVFVRPPLPPRCGTPEATLGPPPGHELGDCLHPAKKGELVVVPSTVVAPVSSEVIVVGGVCGTNGRYVPGKELEWLLSQESVGNFVEAGQGRHPKLSFLSENQAEKHSANYVKNKTLSHGLRIDRGTASTLDDVAVSRGQGWVTITSPSEGTSYITCWTPATEGWDRRRKTVKIHWLDASWSLPSNQVVRSGTEHDLTVSVRKASNGEPVAGWQVEYEVLPGSVPAGFVPTLANKARVSTDEQGDARLRIRQPADQTGPGTTNVQVTVIRPENALGTKERLTIAQSVVTLTWSAPALTVRATGPSVTGRDGQFAYSVDVSNPGDLPAENVQLLVRRPEALEWISGTPNPSEFGDQWVWNLGTLPPRSGPVRVQLVARAIGRGTVRTCFSAQASNVDRQIETCVETRIETPCLGFRFLEEPSRAQVGERVTYRMLVTNECDQPLENIQVEADFDAGLELPGQTSPIGLPPFDLDFGQSKELPLELTVSEAGNQCLRLSITADGGHTLRAQTCLAAEQTPQAGIDIQVQGPNTIREQTPVQYELRLKNTGNLPLSNPRVFLRLSPELKLQLASVQFDGASGNYEAQLGMLEPQTDSLITLQLLGTVPTDEAGFEVYAVSGDLQTEVKSMGVQVLPTRIEIQPEVTEPEMVGPNVQVPGETRSNRLQLSVTELNDPLTLGESGGVLISVTNDRDVPDENLELLVVLPSGLQYAGGREDDTLVFQADPERPNVIRARRREMRPGDRLFGTVLVTAREVGDQQIRVAVTSSGSSAPVEASASLQVIP